MPDKERNSIESYAKMILRMTTPYSGSYYKQAKRLYPKIGRAKHVLLAELLQAIHPRDNTDGPEEEEARRSKERLAMSEAMLKKYGGNGLREKSRLDPLVTLPLMLKRLRKGLCRRYVLVKLRRIMGQMSLYKLLIKSSYLEMINIMFENQLEL